jgi:hypothetical protein
MRVRTENLGGGHGQNDAASRAARRASAPRRRPRSYLPPAVRAAFVRHPRGTRPLLRRVNRTAVRLRAASWTVDTVAARARLCRTGFEEGRRLLQITDTRARKAASRTSGAAAVPLLMRQAGAGASRVRRGCVGFAVSATPRSAIRPAFRLQRRVLKPRTRPRATVVVVKPYCSIGRDYV